MKFVDYYQALGVSEHASDDEIKKAYRKLARKFHPDVSKEPQASEKFQEIGEAYEVLKDKDKRADYDQLRKYGARPGQDFRPPPDWTPRSWNDGAAGGEVNMGDFSEFFAEMFGGGRRGGGGEPFGGADPFGSTGVGFRSTSRGAAMPGDDQTTEVEIRLEEAYTGTQRALGLRSMEVDQNGQVVPKTRTLTVKIPAGVTDGQKIRLKGQGAPGRRGGPPGDLYLQIAVEPHATFALSDRDVTVQLPIAPWEAVLGATVEVPTLGGPVKLNVPPGSQSGQSLRLKGRGLPGKPPGDQFVELRVVVPRQLSPEQKRLFETMRSEIVFDPRAERQAS